MPFQNALKQRIGEDRFGVWFASQTRFRAENGRLIVTAGSKFRVDWLREHFREDLLAIANLVVGNGTLVEYDVDPALARKNNSAGGTKVPAPSPAAGDSSVSVAARSRPATTPAATGEGATTARRKFASLDSFVVGAGNRLAATSVEMVVEKPGSVSPLFLHGPAGSGKTHLLEGIWSTIRAKNPGKRVVYLSAEQFTSHFLDALHGRGLPSFRQKYRGVDVLILDDVQFFAGKKATLIELQHTVDNLLREGKQLVLAADRPPADLRELGPELSARFAGGLVCAIELADRATRTGIVTRFCRQLQCPLPADVVDLIASRVPGDARRLAGAVHRLALAGRAHGGPITTAIAEQALADLVASSGRVVHLPEIERVVCEVFGVAAEDLQSEKKSKCLSQPRMLAMWLARKYSRAGLTEIGSYFGRRSHSTVVSAHKKVDSWIARNATIDLADRPCAIDEAVRRIEARLQAG